MLILIKLFQFRSHYRCIQFECSHHVASTTHHLRVNVSRGSRAPWNRPWHRGLRAWPWLIPCLLQLQSLLPAGLGGDKSNWHEDKIYNCSGTKESCVACVVITGGNGWKPRFQVKQSGTYACYTGKMAFLSRSFIFESCIIWETLHSIAHSQS